MTYSSFHNLDILTNVFSNSFVRAAEPPTREIATVLNMLKARHQLLNRCLDHFCKLMRLLKTSNVPKSSVHIKHLLPHPNTDSALVSYFCSKCNTMYSKETNCSNIKCSRNKGFSKKPSVFVRMPLRSQLQNILLRFPSSRFLQQSDSMCITSSDTTAGEIYKTVVKHEDNNFISLVMNVDGTEAS